MKNLSELRQFLSDVEVEFTGHISLAAAITRLWAGFFDDTWVWGSKWISHSPGRYGC
jgi:hypothetical protein